MTGGQTTIINSSLIAIICLAVITLLWHSNRNRFHGLSCLPLAFALQFFAVLLLCAGPRLPHLPALAGGSALLLGGSLFLIHGLRRFIGKTTSPLPSFIFFLLFIVADIAVIELLPMTAAGDMLLSLALLAVCLRGAVAMLGEVDDDMRSSTRWVGYVFLVLALANLGHLGWRLVYRPQGSLIEAYASPEPLLQANETLTVLLTFSLLLMVVRRLFLELESDLEEKQQAEARLKRQNGIITALQKTTVELLSQLDLTLLLENVVRRAGALTGTSAGYLDLLDEDSGELRPMVGMGALAESLSHRVRRGEGVAGTVWQTGKPLLVDDYDQWAKRIGAFSSGSIKAVLGVPLLSRGKVLGVLGLAHERGSAASFSDDDLELLLQFSRLAVIAITNARLFHEVQRELSERRQVEQALRENEQRLQVLLETLPVGVSVQNPDGRLAYANPALANMLEMSREDILAGVLGRRPRLRPDQTPMEEGETAEAQARRLGRPVHDIETGLITERGKTIWVNVHAAPYPTVDQGLVIATVDTTERKRAEEAIRLCLGLWEFAADHSLPELLQRALDEIERLTGSVLGYYHLLDEEGLQIPMTAWSSRTRDEFCQVAEGRQHTPRMLGGSWRQCLASRRPAVDNDCLSLPWAATLPEGHPRLVRQLVVPTLRDGRVVSLLGIANKAIDYDHRDARLVSHIADLAFSVVEKQRAEERIRHLNRELARLAMSDELTGLANRRSFFSRGEEELRMARRYPAPLSLLMLDIDRFKNVNDQHGHHVGDRVLQMVASTMRSLIREVDKLGRLGGEEFAILLPRTPPGEAVTLAERLRRAVAAQVLENDGLCLSVTISIGVTALRGETLTLDDLLREADTALYRAKNLGRDRVELFDPIRDKNGQTQGT